MGVDLVKCVVLGHSGLSGPQFKLLTAMAVTALDDDTKSSRPSRLYFAGWEYLARAGGRELPDVPPKGHPDRERILSKVADDKRWVMRVLAELRRMQLIETTVDHAHSGERQVYRVLVGLSTGWNQVTPSRVDVRDTQWVDVRNTQRVEPCDTQRVEVRDTPRSNEGPTKDLLQDSTTQATSTTSGVARELEAVTPSSEQVRDEQFSERLKIIEADARRRGAAGDVS